MKTLLQWKRALIAGLAVLSLGLALASPVRAAVRPDAPHTVTVQETDGDGQETHG